MHLPYIWDSTRKSGFVDLATHLLDRRTIFIGPELTSEIATVFCMQIMALSEQKGPIDVYINCHGGSVPAGLAMMDAIELTKEKTTVNTYCVGECVGIAVVILGSGTPGQRRAFPSARISLHQDWYGVESLWGAQAKDQSEHTRLSKLIEEILLRNAKIREHVQKTKCSLSNEFEKMTFMNAYEACELGLIDEVLGQSHQVQTIP